MATYPPPSFYSGIFDTNAFAHGNENAGLTEDEANLLYYKYPVGQAYETLQQTDHTGLATFQAGIDLNAGTLTFPDNTVQSTAYTGGGGAGSLSATLLVGNSAGSTSINMNNQVITSCASLSGLQLSSGVLANNINIGTSNLNLTTTGNGHNIAIGDNIMKFITTANYNTIMGSSAGSGLTTGQGNEGYGSSALQNCQTGSYNTAMGNRAGEKNLGSYNVFLGAQAGQNGAVASTQNTFVGQGAGQNDTGSNNSYLGCSSSITGGVSGSTVIGYLATTGIANTVQLGTTSTNVNCPNTLSVASTTNMSNNLSMNSTSAIANRQISSTYYNFYASNNVATLTYSGRFYGNLNSIVYDCPDTNASGSSSHIFYNYNGLSVLNSLTISNTGITNNTVQPLATDSSTIVPTTAWVQSAITASIPSTPTTTTTKYTANTTFNTPTGCRFIDIQLIGYGGSQGVSDVGPPVFYGGAGSGGNMASITGFAITQNISLTLEFVATSTTGYVSISYTGASGLTNIAKVYNGNAGDNGSQGSTANGATVNSTASIINSRSAPMYVYSGTAGLGSTLSGGGSSVPPATAGTNTSCPNGVFIYQNGQFGCGGTGNTNKGNGLIVITYHLGV